MQRTGGVTTNVLLVDDRRENLLALEAALECLGENLVRADSGAEALSHLQEVDFAAVVLDIEMPGMDGYEVARRIRGSHGLRVPILFVTARDDDAQVAQSYALGAIDHVRKPFSPEILRAKVQALAELKRETLRAEARARDERAATILESISDAFYAVDRQWRITYVNGPAQAYFRRPLEELLGRSLWDDFPTGRGTRFEEEFRRAVHTGEAAHFESFSRLRGIWVDVHAYPSEEGLAIYFRDVTERRRLQEVSDRLAAIVESSSDAIIGRDLEGRVTSWNRAAARMFCYEEAEMLGQPVSRLVPPELQDEEQRILTELRAGRRHGSFETVRRRRSGRPVHASVTISPICDADGAVAGFSEIVRDITERKEADLRKDGFLAMLGHELRNPIGSISNAVRLLRRRGDDPSYRHDYLGAIERQVQALTRLVGDVQTISRIRTGKLMLHQDVVLLQDVIRSAIEELSALIGARDHSLEVVFPEESLWVRADPQRLCQVFSNLISNAAKYTPAEGHIWVTLDEVEGMALVRVRDSGMGFAPQSLDSVFELFEQTPRTLGESRQGLGLGLSLVRGLVELHQGTVSAKSAGPGQGSEFTVTLPLVCPEG